MFSDDDESFDPKITITKKKTRGNLIEAKKFFRSYEYMYKFITHFIVIKLVFH